MSSSQNNKRTPTHTRLSGLQTRGENKKDIHLPKTPNEESRSHPRRNERGRRGGEGQEGGGLRVQLWGTGALMPRRSHLSRLIKGREA
eukprot:1048522-Amorphochlora_amoeboformis.AAC.1